MHFRDKITTKKRAGKLLYFSLHYYVLFTCKTQKPAETSSHQNKWRLNYKMKVERIYTNEIQLERIIKDLIDNQIDQLIKNLYAKDTTTTSHDERSVQS